MTVVEKGKQREQSEKEGRIRKEQKDKKLG
jgi:hypothetical protein